MRSLASSAASAWMLLLLLLAATAADASEPRPGTRKKAEAHRIIIRFKGAGVVHAAGLGPDSHADHQGHELLERRVSELRSKEGVFHAQGLRHVGMAVAHCYSQEACERLVRELEEDPLVEVATPDTLVHFDADSKRGAGSGEGAERLLQDLRPCATQSGCAALGLVGLCCPAMDGMFLACCDGPTTQNLVAIRTKNAKYVTVLSNGTLRADQRKVDEFEKFQLFHNQDGTVSLRGHNQKYITAEGSGGIHSTSDLIHPGEKFTLIHNSDQTISLKTSWGRYFAFKLDGRLRADRRHQDYWTKFRLKLLGGPTQRFPNDANFTSLWGLHDQADEDIDAPEAWRTFTGEFSRGITVAIIDSGIDYTHEDLRENMWVNPGEVPDNGLDDDGNGYADDVHGVDFSADTGDPMDQQTHGTHCAGVVAGVGNNRRGVSGVAWRGARLMALKFLRGDGSGRTSDAVKAIDYAVAHGAKILSSSWGGGGSNAALRVAIERAEAAGVLFVAAAGNDGQDNDQMPHYPSSYPSDGIISVASSTHAGDLSPFSSYGATSVDVAAPGSHILSTVPGQDYKVKSGTSMATPHVSGLAALVWMYRPALSAAQVKEIIMSSTRSSSKLGGKVMSGGRINARKALAAASQFEPPRPPVHPPQALSFRDTDPKVGSIGGTITITAASDESDIEHYSVYYVSSAGFQLDLVGTVIASGKKKLEIALNMSTVAPKFACGFVAVSGNASGEIPAQLGRHGVPNATIEDVGVPTEGPQALSWSGDEDPRPGSVAGTLRLTRAADEASISHYNVYWSNGSTVRGPLLGSVPAIGFQEPLCSGPACASLGRTGIEGGHRFENRNYLNDEQAIITASGPATLRVTRFDVEEEYDFLTVGTYRLTGQPEVPFGMELPAGQITIKWLSDESYGATGWTFELRQEGRRTELRVEAGRPGGRGVEVVPAYGRTELPQRGLYARVQDDDGEQSAPPKSSSAAKLAASQAANADIVKAAAATPARASPQRQPQEPWLRPRQSAWRERRVVWPAGDEASSTIARARRSHVWASLAVPGLDAKKVMPGLRRVFEEALASGLPHTGPSGVRVVRVLGARSDAVKAQSLEAVVEFEVTPTSGDTVTSLDRIEARLILLSKGGQSAGELSQVLLASLAKAGVKLAENTRFLVSEPLQMGLTSPSRRLSEVSTAAVEEVMLEDEEGVSQGAGVLAGACLAALLAAAALAAALAVVRHQRKGRQGAAGTEGPLEGVCVDLRGHCS
mmetsp:Transcript_32854/g.94378  ORF Transcript_32854/g.94378 Transcript_32854/m.94378 type:complete len:1249 (+) Transcript_32854:47-3793(+)